MADFGYMAMCDICHGRMEQRADDIVCDSCGYISWPLEQKDNLAMDALDVKKKLDRREDFILLDVREQEEYDYVNLKDSQLIPMKELPQRIAEMPKDKQIVTFCHTDNRSFHAARFLIQKGFRSVRFMRGGITAWAADIDPSMATY